MTTLSTLIKEGGTVIERVALAIEPNLIRLMRNKGANYEVEVVALVRAAIAAMREPTEAMIDAADRADPDGGSTEYADLWRAMTDAALLAEETKP